MKIKFLGTAAFEGTPAMFCDCRICSYSRENGKRDVRTRSQALVNDDLLIDYPADTYLHTIYGGLDMKKVNNIIITHSHSDHFYPDDLDQNRFPCAIKSEYSKVNVYGNDAVIDTLRDMYGDGSNNNLGFNRIHAYESFEIEGYTILPLPAVHDRSQECLIFMITETKSKKCMIYGNDTGFFTDDCMKYIKGMKLDFISLDCTQGKHRDGNNHMGYYDVIEMFSRLEENGNINGETLKAAQHFSHYGDTLYEEYCEIFKDRKIAVSYDGLELEF